MPLHKHLFPFTCAAFLIHVTAPDLNASWTLLSNFDSDPVAEGWDLTYRRGDIGYMVHTEDPADPDNSVFYVESGGYGTHQSGIWYNMWIVVHNAANPFDDHFQIYVQGGEFDEPTVLNVEQRDYFSGQLTGEYPESAWFRNGTTEPLVTLVIATESGTVSNPFAGDPWYVDDFHMTSGKVIEPPGQSVITAQPQSQVVYAGESAGFSVDTVPVGQSTPSTGE